MTNLTNRTSRKPRYSASDAASRARSAAAVTLGSSTDALSTPTSDAVQSHAASPHADREYVLVSVHDIDPAPWQARLVFNDIDALADSIAGDGETEGVGVVEPILVRRLASGRFELIDGERRWRAAKLVAERREDRDFRVPARVFEVSARIAQLIADAANNERDQPKPLERAIAYRRLREALEQERPGEVIGVRKVAGIGWHKRSVVAQYLEIGTRLTPAVLNAAGVLDANGTPDADLVTKLSVLDLQAAAKPESDAERIERLRAKVERVRAGRRARPARPTAPGPQPTLEERVQQMLDGDGFTIRLRAGVRTLAPAVAEEMLGREVLPALLAFVEQAHGGARAAGCLAVTDAERTVLAVPGEIERLSSTQLELLRATITALAKRVGRAARYRRKAGAQLRPATLP